MTTAAGTSVDLKMDVDKSRLDWIDIAKGIGIILVVYGHVMRGLVKANLFPNGDLVRELDNLIYSFHMPLFFFLAGLLLVPSVGRRGRSGFLWSKVDTIAYPYLVWSLIQGGIEVLLSSVTSGDASWNEVASVIWQPRAQFWFLWALFVIFAFCAIAVAYRSALVLVSVTVAGAAFYVYAPEGALANFQGAGEMLVFFLLGALFQRFHGLQLKATPPLAIVLASLFFAAAYYFLIRSGLRYEDRGWGGLVMAVLGIAALCAACSTLTGRVGAALAYLGGTSMYIYLMHILAASGARILVARVFPDLPSALHLGIGMTAGIALPVVAYHLFKRFGGMWLFNPPRGLSVGTLAADGFRRS